MNARRVAARDRWSVVQRNPWAHAELVALGVGHRDELDLALPDVDAASAEAFQPVHLSVDIVNPQIEVDASLPCFGSETRCRITGGNGRCAGNNK